MNFRRVVGIFSVVSTIMSFYACGDDKSSSANSLPDEVADKAELETYECNMSVIGGKVFVKSLGKNYECDGEEWFESYDQPKSSAKGKSSSSSKGKSSSFGKASSSSSEKVSSSSSSAVVNSSSSLGKIKSSSSNEVESSSSGERKSSSSSRPLSYAEAKVKPLGTYDCDKYNCCPTENLNQDMLAAGVYGEVLDERYGNVYNTVKIGSQIWMAQNIHSREGCNGYGSAYRRDRTRSDTICPKGWHIPFGYEWKILGTLFYEMSIEPTKWISGLRSAGYSGGSNISGFSFAVNPAADRSGIRVDNARYFLSDGYAVEFGSKKIYEMRDRYYNDYSASARCIYDEVEDRRCRIGDVDTCQYGEFVDERDGNVYETIKIGNLIWMNGYLKYSDSIQSPSLAGNIEGASYDAIDYSFAAALDSLRTGCGKMGVACEDKRGVCPMGWHIPSRGDFTRTRNYIASYVPVQDFVKEPRSHAAMGFKDDIWLNWIQPEDGDEYYMMFDYFDFDGDGLVGTYSGKERIRCVKDE